MSEEVKKGGPADWDASTYGRVSTPQQEWAGPVMERLGLKGHETVLDAGCGSGNVTRVLLDALPDGNVIAVDGSPSMIEAARERVGEDRVEYHCQDLARSPTASRPPPSTGSPTTKPCSPRSPA